MVYQRVFSVGDVAQIHKLFHDAIATARAIEAQQARRGGPPRARGTLDQLLRAYAEFNGELNTLAKVTARTADSAIKSRIRATQVRSNRGVGPKLSSLIHSRPLNRFGIVATGEVGIADEAYLDRAINPFTPQYGPFWRAQEFGTGQGEVPSQLGRVLRGFFFKGGLSDPTPPRAQYAGGGGPHPIFVTATAQRAAYSGLGFSGGGGARGGVGGFGTIRHEIRGRHFIRDGADIALADWRAGISRVERDTIARLQGIVRPPTLAQTVRRRGARGRRRP